jgi:hypothetical protein
LKYFAGKMKNLKALVISLFVVFAFASCEKSDVKPKCSHSSSSTEQQPSNGDQNVSGRLRSSSPTTGTTLSNNGNINPNDIVGGGDDDRDGGDKKPKTVGK